MFEFNFEYPEVAILLIIYIICQYFCKKEEVKFYFVHLENFNFSIKYLNIITILKYLSIIFLLTTLASPILIDKLDPKNRIGVDIVLSIDSSGSMSERGFDKTNSKLSKFESVKEVIKEFISKRVNDNVGVVLFGNFAFISSPITYEKDILIELIDLLDVGLAGENTAIGEGIAQGVRAFKTSKAESKILILLSDGEHNSGRVSPQQAVELAKKHKIKIYTIGIGDSHDEMLKIIAKDGGGEFFKANDRDSLVKVYKKIDSLESSIIKSKNYSKKEYLFFYPLILAIISLTLFWWLRYRRSV